MPEIEVTAMTFGPYAIARLDGAVVMVPNGAPGDRLEVSISSRKRDFSIGEIDRVIVPGPHRRAAPCPFLPRCGGCDWQHLDYGAQLRAKSELIAAGLRRANIEVRAENLIEAAPEEFGYRARIRLKVGRDGKLGFYQLESNRLVGIDRCLVAAPGLRIPNAFAKALWRNLEEIEVVQNGEREIIAASMRKPPSAKEIDLATQIFEQDDKLQGVILRSNSRTVIGDPAISVAIEDGLDLIADADIFSQVNHAQNRKLIATVMEMAAIDRGDQLLDIFCGAGNLSLPAARRGARVTGIDSDALAIDAATGNAARLDFADAKFVAGKATDAVNFLIRARYRPQIVILDPPRTGAADLMEAIVKLHPRSIIYVSCDIATLTRDLEILLAAGYRSNRVRAFDFFPNTHHAEIAANLLLT